MSEDIFNEVLDLMKKRRTAEDDYQRKVRDLKEQWDSAHRIYIRAMAFNNSRMTRLLSDKVAKERHL